MFYTDPRGHEQVQSLIDKLGEMHIAKITGLRPHEMYESYFVTVPYVIPGKFVTYAFLYTGGALTQWCTGSLAKKERK